MKKILPFIILLFVINLSGQNFWKQIDESSIILDRDIDRGVVPIKYTTSHLNIEKFSKYLKNAPKQFNKKGKTIPVYIPVPDNGYMIFDVVKSPVMMDKLARKYPNISSYKGVAQKDKKINIRFSIGANGFYASIYDKKGNIYIDPYATGIKNYYISYFTRDYKIDISDINLTCGLDSKELFDDSLNPQDLNFSDELLTYRESATCDSIKQYNYRLALSCTGEWGQRHGGTKEKALSDMVTSVNRINQIYENEFAIHLNLINENDKLIWLDPETDPFDNPTIGAALLGENEYALNITIKGNSYDIGHVFTNRCSDVGGIARLSSVCNSSKAKGVTCHYSDNLNYIITNVTCHEMGHQFSAAHTFNNCSGNESGFGFEPGGGTTIMAYCGLCGSNNVDYKCLETFHSFSIEQVKYFSRIGSGKKCAEKVSSTNTAPEVSLDYNNGFYIPIQTPFVLEGKAFDCEDDLLSYSWEQLNVGPQSQIGDPTGNAPIFTALEPSESPIRYFPKLYDIRFNLNNTNAELLPSYERDLRFRFIARDNHIDAGGTNWADVDFKVDESAGPFLITYPNSTADFHVGDSLEIKWNVANTNNEKVNCQNVDILLSYDKGKTFPSILKYKTPNDGKEIIYLPDTISSGIRFIIKANNSIFLDMSNYNLSLIEKKDTSFAFTIDDLSGQICLPYPIETKIKTRGINGFNDSIRFEVTGLPENTIYSIIPNTIKPGETAKLKFNFDNVEKDAYYEVFVLGISTNGDTIKKSIDWDLYSNSYMSTKIISPKVESKGVERNPLLKWKAQNSYDYVNLYISSNPSFPEEETFVRNYIKDTFYQQTELLQFSTMYYWKLEYGNACGIINIDTLYTFTTFAADCKEYVSQEVPRLINSQEITHSAIDIDEDSTVISLSLRMSGNHSRFRELSAWLKSPNNDTVLIFNNRNFSYQGNYSFKFDDLAKDKMKKLSGTFKPDTPFSILNGKNAKGKWELLIEDNKSQKSGSLKYFSLNVCSKTELINPILVNNNKLTVPYKKPWVINPNVLKVTDENNTSDELIFTIVETPTYCSVFKNTKQLFVGYQFTQSDIDNGLIKILYPGDSDILDKFYFTVIDGEGGSIGITSFLIESDSKVGTEETFAQNIQIFPNPTSKSLTIGIEQDGKFNLDIFNLKGQKLLSTIVEGTSNSINLNMLNNGVFVIKIYNGKYNFVGKIVKQE